MERLLVDFNNRDERDWVRVGPTGLARHAALHDHRLQPGAKVEVVDTEGNRCLGALRLDPRFPPEHQWFVELDWKSWTDAEDTSAQIAPTSLPHSAGA